MVVGHATDRGDAPLWLSSLRRHALPAATSGEGTWWHGDEDKRMGLKAALVGPCGGWERNARERDAINHAVNRSRADRGGARANTNAIR